MPPRQYDRYGEIARRLEQTRGSRKRAVVVQGLLTYVALVLTVVLVCCALESTLHLSSAVRKFMLTGFLLTVVAGAVAFVFRPLFTDWNFEQMALFVEARFPQLRNGPINAVRLTKAAVVISPGMVNEAIREIAEESRPYRFDQAIDRKPLRRAAVCAGVLLVATVIAGGLWADRFFNSLNRILRPTSDIPALGDIKIEEVTPGDTTVVSGDDLVVAASILNPTGRGADATLHYRPEKGDGQVQVMTPRSEIMFATDIPGIKIPFKYRINVGGTQSRWFRVRIVDEPQIISITLKYAYPDYSGKPPESIKNSDGNIKALVGSAVDMTVVANKEIESARLRINDKDDMPLVVSPDGVTLTMPKRMQVVKDGTYVIHITDREGYTNRNPITYYIRAEPDQKPIVRIASPGKDTSVALRAHIPLGIKAADDFGLAKIELVAQTQHKDEAKTKPEQVVKVWDAFPDPKNGSLAFDWKFDGDTFRIGDVITYYARVTDNKPGDAPNVTESSKFKIEVRDFGVEKQAKQKAYFEWRSHVEKALDMQKGARAQTEALLRSLGVNGHEKKK